MLPISSLSLIWELMPSAWGSPEPALVDVREGSPPSNAGTAGLPRSAAAHRHQSKQQAVRGDPVKHYELYAEPYAEVEDDRGDAVSSASTAASRGSARKRALAKGDPCLSSSSAVSAGSDTGPEVGHAFDRGMCAQWMHCAGFRQRDLVAEDLVVRTFTFLRNSGYSMEDICSVAAHGSVYFEDIFESRGAFMGPGEAAHTMVVCMFLAHSFVLDNSRSSRRWHRSLTAKYCSIHIFEEAIMHLMRIRNYRLRLLDPELRSRFSAFREKAKTFFKPTSRSSFPGEWCLDRKFVG